MAEIFFNYVPKKNDVIYFANMCHICHCFGEGKNLKTCGSCNLIQYCSINHQKQDWPTHRDFCNAISQIKKQQNRIQIFEPLKCSDEPDKSISKIINEARYRVEFKADLTHELVNILNRPLKQHEFQMIYFPRVCVVCFESKPALLTNCKLCPQISFCKEHQDYPNHEEDCRKMLIAYSFETNKERFPVLIEIAKEISVPYNKDTIKLPNSMMDFLETYIEEFEEIKRTMSNLANLLFGILTAKFSRSLSLLFALEKLNYTPSSKMTVHVIGANMEDMVDDWELILHLQPQLSELKLVFIGTDVNLGFDKMNPICEICEQNKRKLIVEFQKSLYDTYFYTEAFQKPDIIAGFNTSIYTYMTWNKTVEILGKLNCPLMLTSYNEIEGFKDQEMFSSKFNSAKCVFFQKNPFASLIFYRCHINETVYSQNEFMILYESLASNSE